MLEWYLGEQQNKIRNLAESLTASTTGVTGFWVAKADNGDFVGGVGARCARGGGACTVFGLCVRTDERRKGVAQSLLAVVDMFAQAAGCTQVRASIPPTMQPAVKVLEYCGYSSNETEIIEVPSYGNFEFTVLSKVVAANLALASDADGGAEMLPLRGGAS
jgi:GNAT superfamily N-acetyltransferase